MNPTPIWYEQFCGGSPFSRRRLIIHLLRGALLPLSWLYCAVIWLRRGAYQRGWLPTTRLPIPVLVIGNLTVGGTGKTPLVLHLAQRLRAQGWTPGIVTRGYGGTAQHWPQVVTAASAAAQVGDEAVLLARRSGCLVIAAPQRVAAGQLACQLGCDIVLSDDGLQHYRLARDVEIALIDGERGFGNGHCLPAGPLREPPRRLATVDVLLYHGGCGAGARMRLRAEALVNLRQPERTQSLNSWRGRRVLAVAGIGTPARFFAQLTAAGLEIEARPYPDHHRFTAAEVAAWPPLPVVMTEKDAVKCAEFAGNNHWFLAVTAEVDADFLSQFDAVLKRKIKQSESI
jgi:tetraacyldisaccharide 4'-kinase